MKQAGYFLLLIIMAGGFSCRPRADEPKGKPLLEVGGNYLYTDQVQQIIPPNVNKKDSVRIAHSYIQKWITDVLMYGNAKKNVTNGDQIDKLVEEYRKSLIIQQYQQNLMKERLPGQPDENDIREFYDQYQSELVLKENIIRGALLVVPAKTPRLNEIRTWLQNLNNPKSLEKLDTYSVQNAISYDYFGNEWMSLTEILQKIPVKVSNPTAFVSANKLYEESDSTTRYLLKIESYRTAGQIEPYEMAKDKISNILMNKQKADFISQFETELYNDAIKNKEVTFYRK